MFFQDKWISGSYIFVSNEIILSSIKNCHGVYSM